MKQSNGRIEEVRSPPVNREDRPEGLPYKPPTLEPLGGWSTLTLQQTVPIDFFYYYYYDHYVY
jgi:hypothetical protein